MSAERFIQFNVSLFQNLSLPPGSECIVSVRVENYVENKDGVFYPYKLKLAKFGLVAAQCIADCINGSIPIKLCNLSEKTITLYKNTTVGEFEIKDLSECGNENIFVLDEIEESSCVSKLVEKIENQVNLTRLQKNQASKLIQQYQHIFSSSKTDIGHCKLVKHEIELKHNAPIQQMVGKVPLHVEKWVDNQVEHLEKMGVVRQSNSPWSAPVVVVKKKNGDFRLCVDFRRLNSVTIKPVYRIPDSQSLFNHLSGAKLFSTIDISNAYYQCEMREEDKKTHSIHNAQRSV